jgi:hypothetical protein
VTVEQQMRAHLPAQPEGRHGLARQTPVRKRLADGLADGRPPFSRVQLGHTAGAALNGKSGLAKAKGVTRDIEQAHLAA